MNLGGSGFESSCSHLNFRFHACFDQGVPWHSGSYGVWIHSGARTWHDNNIQSHPNKLLSNCWRIVCVFDHFLGLALKGLSKFKQVHPFLIENIYPFLVNVPHFLTPWKHQKIFSFLIFSGSIENGGNGNIGQKWVNVNILLVSIYKLIHKFVHRQINKLINKWMNNKIHK